MKIKFNSSPFYILFAIFVILENHLFYYTKIPFLSDLGNTTVLCSIIAMVLMFACIANKKIMKIVKPCTNYYWVFMSYLLIFIVAISIFSLYKYNENLYDMFVCVKYFFFMCLFLPVLYLLMVHNDYESIFKIILAITIIYIIIMTIAALLNNFFDIKFLENIVYITRNGRTRLGLTSLFGMAIVYSIIKVFEDKKITFKKLFYVGAILLMFFYQFYVNMTRMYVIAMCVSVVVLIVFKKRPRYKQLIVCITMFLLIIVVTQTNTFDSFISSFSTTTTDAEYASSTIVRQEAREYFKTIVKDNPIFGMGFVSPKNAELTYIFYGDTLTACFDDLGISNMWYHYGVFGVILVVLVFARWIYLSIYLLFSKQFKEKQLVFGIIAYHVCLIPSLSIFDGQRIIVVPLIWALFEYFYYNNKKEVTEINNRIKKQRKIKIKFTNVGKPVEY